MLEQRLGRYAPPDQAGAAERLLLLHDRNFLAELRRTNRCHVSAGSGADDGDVI
jgi:hypothetical protein